MKKETKTVIEYDHVLKFNRNPGINISENLQSGIVDDTGEMFDFCGIAIVVCVDNDWSTLQPMTLVYVKVYPFISM